MDASEKEDKLAATNSSDEKKINSASSTSSDEETMVHNVLSNAPFARNEEFDPRKRGDDLREQLLKRWDEVADKICRGGMDVGNNNTLWFERVFLKHCEETRFYHTAVHLEEMFASLDILQTYDLPRKLSPFERQAITFATFFHDIIYDARSSTNEEDSAKLFSEFIESMPCTSFSGDNQIRKLESIVVQLILATKHHKVSLQDDNALLLTLFLDLDMAVLGKQTPAYNNYASLIRKEYEFVPHDIYCEKRAEILESFLQQPVIFGTEVIREALEQNARNNLRQEIDMLKKKKIPGES